MVEPNPTRFRRVGPSVFKIGLSRVGWSSGSKFRSNSGRVDSFGRTSEKVCKTDGDCGTGTCGHIQQNFPNTGKVITYIPIYKSCGHYNIHICFVHKSIKTYLQILQLNCRNFKYCQPPKTCFIKMAHCATYT